METTDLKRTSSDVRLARATGKHVTFKLPPAEMTGGSSSSWCGRSRERKLFARGILVDQALSIGATVSVRHSRQVKAAGSPDSSWTRARSGTG